MTEKCVLSHQQPHPSPLFDVAARYAGQLSLMELGLGSLLHALHIPCSGFLLSLNQCYVLNRALLVPCYLSSSSSLRSPAARFLPMTISNTAAIIKTLSPYGKKCTPMLAISMQGVLFNVGILLFGQNLLGKCMGSLLLSLWPMVQPALLYGAIYSSLFLDPLPQLSQPYLNQIPFQAIVVGYIFTHMFLSLAVCILTHVFPKRFLDRYDQAIMAYRISPKVVTEATQSSFLQTLISVWKDFTSPFFFISLVLSMLFFYATLSSLSSWLLVCFRLIGVAFLTFFFLRKLPIEWCMRKMRTSIFKKYTPYVEEVLQRIQNMH